MNKRWWFCSFITMPNDEFTSDFFDQASAAWMDNKKKKENCTYVYKCTYTHTDGKTCGKKASSILHMMCYQHRNKAASAIIDKAT